MSLPLARGTCLEVLTQKYFSELTVLPRIELQSVVQVKHLPLIASTSASHLHLKCRLALLCKFVVLCKKMLILCGLMTNWNHYESCNSKQHKLKHHL